MQKKLICICLLVVLSTAQLTVNLERNNVRDTANNKRTVDYLYNYETTDQQRVVFDTRALRDYIVQQSSQTPTGTPSEFTLGSNQYSLNQNTSRQVLKINDRRTSEIDFTTVSVPSQYGQLVTRIVGLQIPSNEQDQFLTTRLGTNIRTRSESFSFLFTRDSRVNKIFFGEIQDYLVQSLLTFPISYNRDNNRWQVSVTQFNKVQENSNYFQSSNSVPSKTAVFDSTTAKILVDSTTLTQVINGITNLGANVDSQKCDLLIKENHILNFAFQLSQSDQNVQAKKNLNSFKVNLNDLLLRQEDGSCLLLLQATTNPTDPWVLGTTFLQNVYAYFNFDDHNIQLSQIRTLTIDSPTTNPTWGTVFIVVGTLLSLLSLAILLALIKPISYVPQPQTKQQPQPQQQNFAQQPAFFVQQPQRVIVYQQQQPLTYSINQSGIGQSPTRFVQQSFPNFNKN